MDGKKKIFISDRELKKMLAGDPGAEIPAGAVISPLSKEWLNQGKGCGFPDRALRTRICETGRNLYALGFVPAADGNISARLPGGGILITPSGVSKGNLKAEDISKIDLSGNLLSGKKPSSEYLLHLLVYRERPEVNAVVHAHPPLATAFACCGRGLSEPLTSETVIALGEVPLAPYATPGTEEVVSSVMPYVKRRNALLLANHGAVTWGRDLERAFQRMETVEHFAKILLNAEKLGSEKPISPEKVKELEEIRRKLGL